MQEARTKLIIERVKSLNEEKMQLGMLTESDNCLTLPRARMRRGKVIGLSVRMSVCPSSCVIEEAQNNVILIIINTKLY